MRNKIEIPQIKLGLLGIQLIEKCIRKLEKTIFNHYVLKVKNTTNLNSIVEAFNNYFNRIADSIHNQIKVQFSLK
jgi:di/tripeptidase